MSVIPQDDGPIIRPGGGDRVASKTGLLFFAALAFVTLLPMIGLSLIRDRVGSDENTVRSLSLLFIAAGNGHVAATAVLFADRGYIPMIRAGWRWFIAAPALAVLLTYGMFRIGGPAWDIFFAAYLVWQVYHYQRQNYGIIAFAARFQDFGALPQSLNLILNLAFACAGYRLLADKVPSLPPIGSWFYVAATLLLIWLVVRDERLRRHWLVLGFIVLGWAFFLPMLFCADPFIGFWSVAIGHGAQYLIFLTVVSSRSRNRLFAPLVMGLVTVLAGAGMGYITFIGAGGAIVVGITMAHFIIDAKAWRMRDAAPRQLIRERFYFIFAGRGIS